MKPKKQRSGNRETCSFCGKHAARLYLKNHTFGQGSQMIVIENVPTYVCDNCHETYIDAQTSRAIDKVLEHPERQTTRREISVATLAA